MAKIVLFGGSAGAIKALQVILPMLPHDFPAAILIVTHIGSHRSIAPEILASYSTLPVRHAIDGEPIFPQCVLIAPPDEHLTVVEKDGVAYVRLVHGPKENHSRPAIDPLFRTAASIFRENTIGVILTGYLDDGTIGLQAIKACGGLAIVQDPTEAEAMGMPASALEHVDIDRVLHVNEIASALVELLGTQLGMPGAGHRASMFHVPNWIDIENRITGLDSDMGDLDQIGKPSSLTCPECGGALWEIDLKGPIRYRCHTGHGFTAKVLAVLQRDVVEEAIWSAVRALHEQERLFSKFCEKERQAGHTKSAAEYDAMAAQAKTHSQILREVITARAMIVVG